MIHTIDELLDQVSDPDDSFVNGLTASMIKAEVSAIFVRRFPVLKDDKMFIEQQIGAIAEKLVAIFAQLAAERYSQGSRVNVTNAATTVTSDSPQDTERSLPDAADEEI